MKCLLALLVCFAALQTHALQLVDDRDLPAGAALLTFGVGNGSMEFEAVLRSVITAI